jgi:hypothetical protein
MPHKARKSHRRNTRGKLKTPHKRDKQLEAYRQYYILGLKDGVNEGLKIGFDIKKKLFKHYEFA